MVEGTRISKLDDTVERLWETTDQQQQLMNEIALKLESLDSKYEQFFQDFRRDWEGNTGCPLRTRTDSGGVEEFKQDQLE